MKKLYERPILKIDSINANDTLTASARLLGKAVDTTENEYMSIFGLLE